MAAGTVEYQTGISLGGLQPSSRGMSFRVFYDANDRAKS